MQWPARQTSWVVEAQERPRAGPWGLAARGSGSGDKFGQCRQSGSRHDRNRPMPNGGGATRGAALAVAGQAVARRWACAAGVPVSSAHHPLPICLLFALMISTAIWPIGPEGGGAVPRFDAASLLSTSLVMDAARKSRGSQSFADCRSWNVKQCGATPRTMFLSPDGLVLLRCLAAMVSSRE